jgi:hypothetical protein
MTSRSSNAKIPPRRPLYNAAFDVLEAGNECNRTRLELEKHKNELEFAIADFSNCLSATEATPKVRAFIARLKEITSDVSNEIEDLEDDVEHVARAAVYTQKRISKLKRERGEYLGALTDAMDYSAKNRCPKNAMHVLNAYLTDTHMTPEKLARHTREPLPAEEGLDG